MRNLLLTLDYELFGDGSGDVFKHIIEPTNAILDIVDRYEAKITVFFEVVEYWRLKQEWESGNHMGYDNNPIKAMEKQVLDIINRGHDVQLHIHPQWVDAKWEDEHWNVDYDNWRLSTFASPSIDMETLIAKGKHTLEEMIRPSFPEYECRSIRAGGYNAQPSQVIVNAMHKLDLKIDTSVVPGAKEQGALSIYDYSSVPNDLGSWGVNDALDVPFNDNADIIELPIVSFPIVRLLKYLSFTRIKSILLNRKSAKVTFSAKTASSNGRNLGLINIISFFFKKEYQTWDFCLFPNWMHRHFLRKALKQTSRDIYVVIGHPKSMVSTNSLEYLLKKTNSIFSSPTVSGLTDSLFKPIPVQ